MNLSITTSTIRLATAVALSLTLVGCSDVADPETEPAESGMSQALSDSMTPTTVSRAAAQQLASKLGLDVDAIETVAAEAVTWANSALGCPKPGNAYMQALTPGFRVELDVDGRRYYFHAGQNGTPFECPANRAQPPAAGEKSPV